MLGLYFTYPARSPTKPIFTEFYLKHISETYSYSPDFVSVG